MNNKVDRHFSAFKGELGKLYGFKKGYLFMDLTLGDGGHTQEALESGCRVISFDVDPEAIVRATGFVSGYTPLVINDYESSPRIPENFQWVIVRSNFTHVEAISEKLGFPLADGIMVDLGPSQFQVLSEGRGFSFSSDEPLDMRLDTSLGVTASDLLAVLNEGELAELFAMADEPFAKPIARIIVKLRSTQPIKTTKQLSEIVSRIKHARSDSKIHPATKVFMALRMAVNLERENIRLLLPQLPRLLKTDGIVGIISFHSGEDKLIKDFFSDTGDQVSLRAINKKPIEPSADELLISPRTRSAKLRLAKKYK